MWHEIGHYFDKYPMRKEIASLLLKYGLKVKEDEKIYCNDIEIPYTSIAKVLNVDRRVVKDTVKMILKHEELSEIFKNLNSVSFYNDLAKKMRFGIVEIYATARKPGIVANVSSIISKEGISIRQVLADDPYLYPEPKLTIITEKKIPGELLSEILELEGIDKVTIY